MKIYDVQKALYQYLHANLEIQVENKINLDVPMPFVGMDNIRGERLSARGLEGFTVTQTLMIYSHFSGKDEIIKWTDAIRELINGTPIEIENGNIHTQSIERFLIEQISENEYEAELTLELEIYEY